MLHPAGALGALWLTSEDSRRTSVFDAFTVVFRRTQASADAVTVALASTSRPAYRRRPDSKALTFRPQAALVPAWPLPDRNCHRPPGDEAVRSPVTMLRCGPPASVFRVLQVLKVLPPANAGNGFGAFGRRQRLEPAHELRQIVLNKPLTAQRASKLVPGAHCPGNLTSSCLIDTPKLAEGDRVGEPLQKTGDHPDPAIVLRGRRLWPGLGHDLVVPVSSTSAAAGRQIPAGLPASPGLSRELSHRVTRADDAPPPSLCPSADPEPPADVMLACVQSDPKDRVLHTGCSTPGRSPRGCVTIGSSGIQGAPERVSQRVAP